MIFCSTTRYFGAKQESMNAKINDLRILLLESAKFYDPASLKRAFSAALMRKSLNLIPLVEQP